MHSAPECRLAANKARFKRIATEEAFSTPELMAAQRELLAARPADEPGFVKMWGDIFTNPRSNDIAERLVDLGERRLKTMDEAGVAMQVVSITSPGVQIFDAEKGTALARSANDRLIAAVQAHPDRFAGLAAIAPQDPAGAAKELERAVKGGLKGALINSHTKGEYLDDPKFWVIFEKAQELVVSSRWTHRASGSCASNRASTSARTSTSRRVAWTSSPR